MVSKHTSAFPSLVGHDGQYGVLVRQPPGWQRTGNPAEFAAGICKDAGYGAVGTQIEIFGKLSVLAVSMPILLALIETLQVFLS